MSDVLRRAMAISSFKIRSKVIAGWGITVQVSVLDALIERLGIVHTGAIINEIRASIRQVKQKPPSVASSHQSNVHMVANYIRHE